MNQSHRSNSGANKSLKQSPWAWLALVFAAVGLIVLGGVRDSGPRTPDERISSIEKRIACPVCNGESVYESRTSASEQIRQLIRQEVRAGKATDDEIVAEVSSRYQNADVLVPSGRGVDALAWLLPAMALVFGAIGLALAFRRWRQDASETAAATDADYQIVAEALNQDEPDQLDGSALEPLEPLEPVVET